MNGCSVSGTIPESLPGYIKKSFKMAFGGGEIWFEHLDGMYSYEYLVISKLQSDKPQFMRPSYPSLFSVNLDQTVVTDNIAKQIILSLTTSEKRFLRVCFTGVKRSGQKLLIKWIKALNVSFAYSFVNDFEKAKEWLVSEKY